MRVYSEPFQMIEGAEACKITPLSREDERGRTGEFDLTSRTKGTAGLLGKPESMYLWSCCASFYSVQLAAAREAETGEGEAEEREGDGFGYGGDSEVVKPEGIVSGGWRAVVHPCEAGARHGRVGRAERKRNWRSNGAVGKPVGEYTRRRPLHEQVPSLVDASSVTQKSNVRQRRPAAAVRLLEQQGIR